MWGLPAFLPVLHSSAFLCAWSCPEVAHHVTHRGNARQVNPVRAGMVVAAEQWRWPSAAGPMGFWF
jgi:hypothetical protein